MQMRVDLPIGRLMTTSPILYGSTFFDALRNDVVHCFYRCFDSVCPMFCECLASLGALIVGSTGNSAG